MVGRKMDVTKYEIKRQLLEFTSILDSWYQYTVWN